MRNLLYAVAALCALFLVPNTKADTIFALQDVTFKSGATATGNIRIDTDTGAFVSADVTYQLGAFAAVFSGPFDDPGTVFNGDQIFTTISSAAGDLLLVDLPTASLVGYMGGPFCSDANLCDDFRSFVQIGFDPIDQFTDGRLVPLAATPEPSSLLLVCTGMLACMAALKRKRQVFLPSRY